MPATYTDALRLGSTARPTLVRVRALSASVMTTALGIALTYVVVADTQPSGPWALPVLLVLVIGGGACLLWNLPAFRAAVRLPTRADTPLLDDRLADLASALGDEVEQFVWRNDAGKPVLEVGVTPKEEWAFIRSRQLNLDLIALDQYEHRLSGRVFRLVDEFQRRGYVSPDEGTALNRPQNMAEVWRVAERLQALGHRLQAPALTPTSAGAVRPE